MANQKKASTRTLTSDFPDTGRERSLIKAVVPPRHISQRLAELNLVAAGCLSVLRMLTLMLTFRDTIIP